MNLLSNNGSHQPRLKKRLLAISLSCSLAILSPFVHAESYLIKGATLHTATAKGVLKNADVLIQNGKISQVSQGLNLADIKSNEEIQVIDGKDKHVTPGLINASTTMGLVEIDAVSSTVDEATTSHAMSASFNIAPAINFRSTLIPQNRINGLTRAIVLPSSDKALFAGQGSAIVLQSSMQGLLNDNVAVVAAYGDEGADKAGGSRAAAMQLLEQALTDARYLRSHEARYLPGYQWEFSLPVNDLKALYPVLDKKVPLVVSAHRADDILRLIALSKKHKVRLVIRGGGEAWTVAKQLAESQVPVIMDPMRNLPQFESLSVRIDGAAKLYQAGVKLLLTGGGTHNAYLVRQSAGNAVAYGLPAEAAVEAMTINTAEVFGLKNYGQLKAGMEADIVVWDGDPLEITSNPEVVLIQGESQPMVSRATRLRDRYWDLSKDTQPAFSR